MTVRPVQLLQRSSLPAFPAGLPRIQRQVVARPPEHKLLFSYVLSMVAACLLVFLVNVTIVSQLQHWTAQHRLYGEFRLSLAEGSIPIGQTDVFGALVSPGTAVAQLKIPSLGVDEIVVDGTASSQTMTGVGHRRDTPLPGQAGVSVLMGRAAAYGGTFGDIGSLAPGAELTVLTGQGQSTYRVLGVRTDTTILPVLSADQGRLTLVTASGPAYRPDGVTRVDAELVGTTYPRPPVAIGPGAIPASEEVLAGDSSRSFALSWLVLLLACLVMASIWSWKRWRKPATWLVFAPVLGAVALAVAASVTTLLPNLL